MTGFEPATYTSRSHYPSDGEKRIALGDLLFQLGAHAFAPAARSVNDPIAERAAVGRSRSHDWARNTHKLRLKNCAHRSDDRKPLSTHVKGREVRRYSRIRQR